MAEIPIDLDIEITTGDDKDFNAVINGLDLSSYGVFFTVKENTTDTDANALVKIDTSSITHSSTGVLSIPMYARDAASSTGTPLTPGNYYYDIQLVTPSGKVQTWWKGRYIVGWHSTVRTA